MSRYIGNYIRATSTEPTQSSTPGIWSLCDQLAYRQRDQWPIERDPYYNLTTLHLPGSVASSGNQATTLPVAFNSDSSTNKFLVTPNGDVRASSFSPYGTSWSNYFDGVNDYIATAANNLSMQFGTAAYTVEFWVYQTSLKNDAFAIGGSGTIFQLGFYSTGLIQASLAGVAGFGSATIPVPINQWVHVAAVRTSTAANGGSYYINGQFAGYFTDSYNHSSAISTINIGTTNAGNATYTFPGYISNLRIAKSAIYTTGFTPSTSPLTTSSQNATNVTLLTCQSNRFIDNSATPNTLTALNGPTVSQNSPFVVADTASGSGYFDGTGDYLSIASNSAFAMGTGDFTVELWFYPLSYSGSQNIISHQYNTGFAFGTQASTGTVEFYIANSFISTTTRPTLNMWNHVVCQRASGTASIYINGTRVQTGSLAGNTTSTTALIIGAAVHNLPNEASNGYMSDIRIVKGTAVYSGTNITVPTAPLQAISGTSLLTLQTRHQAQNSGFLDSSPNNFVVTRSGNVSQGSFSPFLPTGWSTYVVNGTSTQLRVSDNAALRIGTSQFNIEAWVYPTSYSEPFYILRKRAYNNVGVGTLAFTVANGAVTLEQVQGPATIASTSAGKVPLNTWTHVAVSRDSLNNVRIFINGVVEATASSTYNFNDSSNPISLLCDYDGRNASSIGYCSNFRFVIGSAIYTSAFTPSTSPLTTTTQGVSSSDVKLLLFQSNRFVDNSSNNFSITTSGTPSVQAFSPFAPTSTYLPQTHGGSIRVSASGDIISWPQNTWNNRFSSNNWSIEAWVYPTTSTSTEFFVDQWTNGTTTTSLIFTFMSGNFDVYIGSTLYTLTGVTPTLNSWTHIAAVRTGGTFSVFQNGVRTHTRADLGSGVVNNGGTANRASPGFGGGGTGCYFHGHRIVIGSNVPYDATNTIISIPTTPVTAIPGTISLLSATNAGIVDATGKNVLETAGNSQVSTSVSKFGSGSMVFDGTADALRIPDDKKENLRFGTGDFTIEFWAWKSANGSMNYDTVISIGSTGNYSGGFSVELSATRGFCFIYDSAVQIQSNFNPNDSTWYHYAVVRNGSTFALYKNGSRLVTSTLTPTLGTTGTAYVGAGALGDNSFNGYINDLRVTKGLARYTGSTYTVPSRSFLIG